MSIWNEYLMCNFLISTETFKLELIFWIVMAVIMPVYNADFGGRRNIYWLTVVFIIIYLSFTNVKYKVRHRVWSHSFNVLENHFQVNTKICSPELSVPDWSNIRHLLPWAHFRFDQMIEEGVLSVLQPVTLRQNCFQQTSADHWWGFWWWWEPGEWTKNLDLNHCS